MENIDKQAFNRHDRLINIPWDEGYQAYGRKGKFTTNKAILPHKHESSFSGQQSNFN